MAMTSSANKEGKPGSSTVYNNVSQFHTGTSANNVLNNNAPGLNSLLANNNERSQSNNPQVGNTTPGGSTANNMNLNIVGGNPMNRRNRVKQQQMQSRLKTGNSKYINYNNNNLSNNK